VLALLGAFVAGVLTTLAPCVLPLLPVIVGGSMAGAAGRQPATVTASGAGGPRPGSTGAITPTVPRTRTPLNRALVITTSLGASIVVFTLLLRASTALLGIPSEVWSWLSGGILVGLGLASLFPAAWDAVSAKLGLQARSSARLAKARQRDGVAGEILTGAALGPVFSSCSPLYAYVVASVIPAEFFRGLLLLAAYTVGLCGTLLVIALLGQRAVRRLGWLADPHGWFRRCLGVVFVVVGVFVITGLDRDLQTWVIENSPVRPWELDSGFIPD
jgi:cytochrome c biogenesis protein CcdA